MHTKQILLVAILFVSLLILTVRTKSLAIYNQTSDNGTRVLGTQTNLPQKTKPKPENNKVTQTPTVPPIPTVSPTPTTTHTPSPVIKDTDTATIYMMNEINKYRQSLGLSAVTTNSLTCNFAKTRAKEISVDFSHNGFDDRAVSGGLPYKSYTKITENLAEAYNYKDVVNIWIQSGVHSQNMRADTPYVCVEKYGNFYAYEGWKP